MFGELDGQSINWSPLKTSEDYALIILMILVLVLGFFPESWLDMADQATSSFIQLKSKG